MPFFSTTMDNNLLKQDVQRCISLAINYAIEHRQTDGHFYGEMQSNSTITAEYIFMRQALGIDLKCDAQALIKWLQADQSSDGSWNLGHGLPGDVSITAEVYLALKILGVPADTSPMCLARQFMIKAGGIEKVRVFTRIFFAMFGLFPWKAVPQLPPELILLPSQMPINIYRLSSWARITLVPLIVVVNQQPIFELPNGKSAQNDFLDELWCNPARKSIPYAPSLPKIWWDEGIFSWSLGFTAADLSLYYLKNIIQYTPLRILRNYATQRCVAWILERQEKSGDWAGIFPPMINALLMLHVEGYSIDSDPVCRGLAAMERFIWKDRDGMRVQPCVSPVWDTILMTIGLRDCDMPASDKIVIQAMDWVLKRQLLGQEGDWRVYRPQLNPGGWSFEYHNSWYPDVDDTAAVIIALVKQNPKRKISPFILKAIEWLLGMQNTDGGWAAFDVGNDKLYLNQIPFSDMEALCDPSTADVTGRVLEAFGIICSDDTHEIDVVLGKRMQMAMHRAISYLASVQEPGGSWWGRWGVNYIYGTSNVLCALAYPDGGRTENMVKRAIQWLKDTQRADGSWGEGLDTYLEPKSLGRGESTASQTAWALMGLLDHIPVTDKAIERGIRFLVSTQIGQGNKGATWVEPQHTGTGFPGHFYLRYDLYRHYFPMMALGRYASRMRNEMQSKEKEVG